METIITILVGAFLLFIGILVLRGKALFLVNLILWNGVEGDQKLLSRIFGSIIIISGFGTILLPFLMKG